MPQTVNILRVHVHQQQAQPAANKLSPWRKLPEKMVKYSWQERCIGLAIFYTKTHSRVKKRNLQVIRGSLVGEVFEMGVGLHDPSSISVCAYL